MTPNSCSTCGGRQWTRGTHGWRPCGCYWTTLSTSFILPAIRQRDVELPSSWLGKEPWPLDDRLETGSYADFRSMVWRSLLAHYRVGFTYDYFEVNRLNEISFDRDEKYKSVRELKDLDLLVLVKGLGELRNSFISELEAYVQSIRQMHGKPTWVYNPKAGIGAHGAPRLRPEPRKPTGGGYSI